MSVNEASFARYRVDASRSRFIVEGSAEGLLSVFGHNPVIAICGFGGDARFSADKLETGSLLMLAQANSLVVLNDVSEKDRREMERAMHQEVLESARYPEVVFMSTSIKAVRTAEDTYRAQITGNLALRDVTRQLMIDAQVTVNGSSLRAQGEFPLRQTDYNIKPVAVAGGTLRMKDELKLSFDIWASK